MAFAVAARLLVAVTVVAVIAGANDYGDTFTARPDKDAKCYNPTTHNCNASIYPILKYKMSAWFYHELFKSCRPLYANNGENSCPPNKNLPVNREECERLCGEKCTTDDGIKGLCTFDEYCSSKPQRSVSHPKPCGAYGVICCPLYPVAETKTPAVKSASKSPRSTTAGPLASIVYNMVGEEAGERHRYL